MGLPSIRTFWGYSGHGKAELSLLIEEKVYGVIAEWGSLGCLLVFYGRVFLSHPCLQLI
jgi:hypothetical protein